MRIRTLLLCLAVVAVGVVVAVNGALASQPSAHLSESRILNIALAAAAQAGDPQPALVQHAAGTRRQANLVDSGDIVPGNQPSYLIAMRGHFVFEDAPTPPGAAAPHGSVMTIVVDALNGAGTDSGVSNRYPDLRRLGPVTTDYRAPAHPAPGTTTVPGVETLDLVVCQRFSW
jgi:hypothetical protein